MALVEVEINLPHTVNTMAADNLAKQGARASAAMVLNFTKFSQNRADSRFAPSQWETLLQSNTVSHWLGTESALQNILASALWSTILLPTKDHLILKVWL